MRKIKKKELIEFIFSQPAKKLVNMSENYFHEGCGCLGIQYVREKFPQVAKIALGCGSAVVDDMEGRTFMKLEDGTFFNFVPPQDCFSVLSYGRVQEFLKTQEWAKPFIPKNA